MCRAYLIGAWVLFSTTRSSKWILALPGMTFQQKLHCLEPEEITIDGCNKLIIRTGNVFMIQVSQYSALKLACSLHMSSVDGSQDTCLAL